jgi:hypothetical protein
VDDPRFHLPIVMPALAVTNLVRGRQISLCAEPRRRIAARPGDCEAKCYLIILGSRQARRRGVPEPEGGSRIIFAVFSTSKPQIIFAIFSTSKPQIIFAIFSTSKPQIIFATFFRLQNLK